ncbi:hypothetical protein OAN21_02150 [Alphaproteobacteria bacterium]|nr:hypothetical protein [Alphaproteobacteria bacterium]
MAAFSSHCADLLKRNGYVGFDLQAFDLDQSSAFVFSHAEIPYVKIGKRFLSSQKTRPLGYKKAFLFLSETNRRGVVQADFFMETNEHHINNMQASFRGEADCRWFKMGGCFSTFHFLTGEKKMDGENWDYYYRNILTRERIDSMRCFLEKLLKIIKK